MQRFLLFLFFFYPICLTAQHVAKVTNYTTGLPLTNFTVIATWNNAENRLNKRLYQSFDKNIINLEEEIIKSNASLEFIKHGFAPFTCTAGKLVAMNYIVELRENELAMLEVTVSAQKFKEIIGDIPRQIDVFERSKIEYSNSMTHADLLMQSGQVFVQKSQLGGGSPVLRGFEANKVLLVIDGVRMNNAIYRGGHLQNVLRIDPMLTDKLEVMYGAGSVIYGSDALGGVMHFKTIQPQTSKSDKAIVSGQVSSSYQSAANYFSTHAHVKIGHKKWASLTGITYSTFGDLVQGKNRNTAIGNLGKRDSVQQVINGRDTVLKNDNPHAQSPSGYVQLDILQKILFKPNEHTKHLLNLQYSNTGNVPRYDRLSEISPSNNRLRFAEWYYGPELRSMAAYQYRNTHRNILFDEIELTTAFQYIEESRINRSLFSKQRTKRNETVQVVSANLDAQKIIHHFELRYGLEYTYNDVKSVAYNEHIETSVRTPTTTRYPDGGSNMATASAYINSAYEFSPKWIVNAGIRASYISLNAKITDRSFLTFLSPSITQQHAAVNYTLGLVYKTSSALRWYSNLSTGFRAPNIDDFGKTFESAGGNQIILPNSRLRSEYTYNLDIGMNWANRFMKWENVIWGTLIRDAISTQPSRINGNDSIVFQSQPTRITQLANNQNAYIFGFNSSVIFRINQWLSTTQQLTYTYGRILTDSSHYPLDHIPPLYGLSKINITFNKIQYELGMLYHGAKLKKDYNLFGEDNFQYATPNGTPSWYIMNAKCVYHIPVANKKLIQVIAGVENILDRNYRVFASGISAPGRNYFITVRASF